MGIERLNINQSTCRTVSQVTWTCKGAHDWPVNTLHNVSEGILASGDDQGVVKVWIMAICTASKKNM